MPTNKYLCPCCGFLTLHSQGDYEICPVCFWEDDPVQTQEEISQSGANKISLLEARQNYLRIGVMEQRFKKYVRAPHQEEIP